jgi:hypothetical protein
VPLPQGNEQFLNRTLWPGEGEIGPGETIDINIDDYFGDLVTFQAADAQGNLLPNARVDILPQFCRGDIRATFTGQAQWQRNTFDFNRICLRVTVDGEVFQPGPDTLDSQSAANLSITRDVSGNTATITAFDEVVLFSDRATPPQVGVAQIVDADGNRLEGRGSRFFAGGNDGTKLGWRPGGDLGFTRVYLETGTFDFSRQGEPEFLGTYDILPGEELQIVYETGQRFGTAPAADSLADMDAIFFDDFESEVTSSIVRNYDDWTNWEVVSGTVDAISGDSPNPALANIPDNNGHIMDLDGSRRQSGVVTTREQFSLEPGTYNLTFEATSSTEEGSNTFRVTVGDLLDETITVTTDQSMTRYAYIFTVDEPATVGITFDHTPTEADNHGAFIDNVRLGRGTPDTLPDTTSPLTERVIFFDDFEQEGVDDLVRNYVNWANWTVVSGTVDAINGARIRNADASYGVMVDLDGSTRESGIFTTTRQFTLAPDDYTLSFDAASSRMGQDNTFRVTIGDVLDETITISTEEPIATYSYTFTVSQPTTVGITFDHTLTSGDNNGAYIDNVRLATAGTTTVAATPPSATTVAPTAFPTPIQTPGTPPPAGTGELLTFGLPIEGTLTSGETDLWTFVGSEGQPIDIIVDGSNLSGSGDTLMTLVSPDGSLLLTIDDNDMAGTLRLNPGLDDYVLPASGNYTLQVRALDPSTTGPYTLSIRTD